MAWNRNFEPWLPFWPALWISAAATDSGKTRSGSETMTRRRKVTNMIPRSPPTNIRADDLRYASTVLNFVQAPEMRKAGIVKIAPAAMDSPMDPTVLAMFSSRIEPFMILRMAMPMTAAGYVAAIVIPALSPR